MKSKGIQGDWATPFPFTGSMTVQSLLWQYGGELFSAGRQQPSTWADEPGVKAMTWFADLVKNGHSPAKIAQDADFIALQNGKNAFNWNGIWSINTLKEQKNLEWGVAALPNIGGKPAAWAGSHQFVLPTQKSAGREQGHCLPGVRQLDQPAVAGVGQGRSGAGPQLGPRVRGIQGAQGAGRLGAQIDDLHFLPPVPGIGDAMAEWDKALNESVLGIKDPQAALSDAAGPGEPRSWRPTRRSTGARPP